MKNLPVYVEAHNHALTVATGAPVQPELHQQTEKSLRPDTSARLALTQRLVRLVLGLCWIYQGVVPKLLFPDTGELRMVQSLGFSEAAAHQIASAAGIGEILFGLLFWVLPRGGLQVAYWLNIVGLLGLGIGVLFSQPAVFIASFNPFSLNLSMMTLAAVGLLTLPDEQPGTSRGLRQSLP